MRIDRPSDGWWQRLLLLVRAACGVPDYDAYLLHCRLDHPERVPPSRAEFHRERERARYARGRSRCC